MRPGYDESPLNPVPPVIWALVLPMVAFEAYFGLGQLGFIGGGQPGAGLALRQIAAERTAYVPEFVLRLWQMRMHVLQDLVGGMRTGHRQHLRMRLANQVLLGAQTTGNDHPAVLGQSLADGVERLFDGGIDETTGIDDHQVGTFVRRRNQVAFGAQPSEDLFGIDQCLRAPERNEADVLRWKHEVALS